jgi:hypothetical protein
MGVDGWALKLRGWLSRSLSAAHLSPLRQNPGWLYMANEASGSSLLDELDARQNEVLDGLERLNHQIEQVIAQWSGERQETLAPKLAAAA